MIWHICRTSDGVPMCKELDDDPNLTTNATDATCASCVIEEIRRLDEVRTALMASLNTIQRIARRKRKNGPQEEHQQELATS